MAAYESWAGGTISQPAGAPSRGSGGGYIPVAEIPNAPKTVSMPMYHPANAPNIRYDYARTPPDVKSRGAALMQKPLPSSFEEAGDIRTSEAGKGQMAYGKAQESAAKAFGEAGQDFGKAMFGAAAILDKINTQAQESKDSMDKLLANQAIETYNKELDRITAVETPDKWGTLKAEADKNLQEATSKLGATRVVHDTIQASVMGVTGGTTKDGRAIEGSGGQHLRTAGGLKTIKQAQDLATSLIEDGRAQKDWNKAKMGVDALLEQKVISPEQAKEMHSKNAFLQGTQTLDEALLTSKGSTMLQEQAKAVRESNGKIKSKDFPVLNSNPSLAADLEYKAGEALKKHKADDLQEITEQIEHGDLRTPDAIRKAAKGKFLSLETVERLANSGNIIVEDNANAHNEVRKAISDYNYYTDEGGENFEKIHMQIRTTIPKERRAPYESMLTEKMKKGAANKSDTPLEKSGKNVLDKLKTIDESNMLPATDKEREQLMTARRKMDVLKSGKDPDTHLPLTEKTIKKWTPTVEEKAAWEANGTRVRELQEKTDQIMKDHPDTKPEDLWDQVFEKTPQAGNYEKNAGNSTDAAPRAERVDVEEREKKIARALNLPVGMGATGPRDLSAGGRQGSPEYKKAAAGPGAASEVRATAYTKDEPGGNQVASRSGELFTMEKYAAGKVPYVSAAMDDNSKFQGKLVVFTAHPNVVFKIEDRGGAFVGKGDSAIDIAYDDNDQAKNYESHGTIKEISVAEAAEINGTNKVAGGPGSGAHGVVPQLTTKLNALEQQFGPLKIRSGYRDPEHNKSVGGARASEHTSGDAVDIDVSDKSHAERLQMIAAANQQGIQGVGVYSNTLHFDLGFKHGRRAWGPSHGRESIPDWARGTLVQLRYINA